jgi:hypothetical protein
MIDIEASVSTRRNWFAAFYVFCLQTGKGLTRRANQEHKDIIAEFVNARSGDRRCGHFAVGGMQQPTMRGRIARFVRRQLGR